MGFQKVAIAAIHDWSSPAMPAFRLREIKKVSKIVLWMHLCLEISNLGLITFFF